MRNKWFVPLPIVQSVQGVQLNMINVQICFSICLVLSCIVALHRLSACNCQGPMSISAFECNNQTEIGNFQGFPKRPGLLTTNLWPNGAVVFHYWYIYISWHNSGIAPLCLFHWVCLHHLFMFASPHQSGFYLKSLLRGLWISTFFLH
jgi:hypothetical protein